MEKVSVIVPIYKVEKYINECVDSIISQTYKNLEIILVDDGSPDNCDRICNEYAKKDKRIKAFHIENGGLSNARNYGIKHSTGKYLAFIDSDDYIEKEFIETLYNSIIKNNAEIAQCSYFAFYDDEKLELRKKNNQDMKEIVYSNIEALHSLYSKENGINTVIVCNKLYKRELFDDVSFPIGKLHEDVFTTHEVLYKANKVVMLTSKLYNYRQRKESIMNKKFNIKRLDAIEAYEQRMAFFEKIKDEDLVNKTKVEYMISLCVMYYNTKKYLPNSLNIQNDLIDKYKRINKNITSSSLKTGFYLYTMSLSPNIFYFIYNMGRKIKSIGR